jgi:PIN domain nuclease of toxin-antitoxin system
VRLLLDTHIWIWSVAAPERLSRKVTSALTSPKAELWLSPISVWEVLILVEKGRIELDRPGERWVQDALSAAPLRDAPITREVAIESRRLRLGHQDPADRFIAATARVYDLTLVTADKGLASAPGLAVLANR